MKTTKHFICEVKDSINNYNTVVSNYIDTNTEFKAIQFFKKHKEIKKYFGDFRYQIIIRQNAILIQDPK